jgi:ELWxxDGT repeat protein
MKITSSRRWSSTRRAARRAGPPSRARRRQAPALEALEERVTLSLTPQMVLDINPGVAPSYLYQMVAIGSTAYFTLDEGVHGIELWKSDGTAAGTTLVKDIAPGGASGSSPPSFLTSVNGTLFFSADDGTHGRELWRSDGTAAGTTLVKDIAPGDGGSQPIYLTNVNGTLFFAAGSGLWKSDGTAAGTTLLKGFGTIPRSLTNVNGMLYFSAYNAASGEELWKSDGTAAGTTLVKDISPGGSYDYYGSFYPNSSSPRSLTNVNGTLFFSAQGTGGRELWKSDGTAAGTTLVKDIYPGYHDSSPAGMTAVNGTVFFKAYNDTNGTELWKSDGTAAGTVLVKDINSGFVGSNPDQFTNVNGTLFFTAYTAKNGSELWRSDGTAAGTVLVKDIIPGSSGSNPYPLTDVNGTLFFTVGDGANGWKLWKSDGTAAGTALVSNLTASGPLTNVNGTLFFVADDGIHGWELWKLADQAQPTPTLSIRDVTVTEGNAGTRAATFTVTLSAPSAQPVTVQYATANGTATAGSDYQARSGTLTIPAGQTTGTITVPVIGDRLGEPDETFLVNLSGATGATIADGQAVGTILDDEPRIRTTDVSKKEGNGKQTILFTFTVTLSVPYDQPVTMSYSTVDGTATTGDGDYIAKSGTLTFAPGETSRTITIEVNGDRKKEANEIFYLDLSGNSGNSLFTKKRGIGTILNDD